MFLVFVIFQHHCTTFQGSKHQENSSRKAVYKLTHLASHNSEISCVAKARGHGAPAFAAHLLTKVSSAFAAHLLTEVSSAFAAHLLAKVSSAFAAHLPTKCHQRLLPIYRPSVIYRTVPNNDCCPFTDQVSSLVILQRDGLAPNGDCRTLIDRVSHLLLEAYYNNHIASILLRFI